MNELNWTDMAELARLELSTLAGLPEIAAAGKRIEIYGLLAELDLIEPGAAAELISEASAAITIRSMSGPECTLCGGQPAGLVPFEHKRTTGHYPMVVIDGKKTTITRASELPS